MVGTRSMRLGKVVPVVIGLLGFLFWFITLGVREHWATTRVECLSIGSQLYVIVYMYRYMPLLALCTINVGTSRVE